MKTALVALVILAAAVWASPARAADAPAVSWSVIRVMPGGDHVMRDGDPIRVCGMARTIRTVPGVVRLYVDTRNPDSRRRRWHTVVTVFTSTNVMRCLYAVVHQTGRMDLRVRTMANRRVAGSASRVVRVTVR